ACRVDFARRVDLSLLGLALLGGLLGRDLGALRRAPHLDLALLLEARILLLLRDLELEPLGLEILRLDRDLRVLLDVVALLAPRLDGFRELRQTLGVEGVLRIE